MNLIENPPNRPPPFLETERLLLRRPRIEDAEAIYQGWTADPEVTRYMTWAPHQSLAETCAFLQRSIESWRAAGSRATPEYVYIIEDRETNAVMGTIGLRPESMKAELGYCLAREYWNNGYMTEAVKAIINWGLRPAAYQRVQAFCDAENIGSARVMEKSGMSYEGTLKSYLHSPNIERKRLRDAKLFAATK
ncbi:MAG: GNAT family N-acetyltransferase [Verrucomicrobiota bacterium]